MHPELPSRKAEVVFGIERRVENLEGSEEITNRLDKVVGQLNIITKTLNILEQRMRVTEGQVSQLIDRANAPIMEPRRDLIEEGKEREPMANPLIEAEREDMVGYTSGHFKAETLGAPVIEHVGQPMEARLEEPLEQLPDTQP